MKIFVHYKQKKSLIQSHEIPPASTVSFMDLDFGNKRCFLESILTTFEVSYIF
jgi:hypothetical protein